MDPEPSRMVVKLATQIVVERVLIVWRECFPPKVGFRVRFGAENRLCFRQMSIFGCDLAWCRVSELW